MSVDWGGDRGVRYYFLMWDISKALCRWIGVAIRMIGNILWWVMKLKLCVGRMGW